MKVNCFLLVASMAFAISCSSGENEGGDTQSSSSSDVVSSSSLNIVSSSSLNTVSSSSLNVVPSSSSNIVSSSSSNDASNPSSSSVISSSSSSKCDVTKGSFTDTRNNQTYNTVKICEQTWMAENLNFNANSSVCYDNEESNCEIYGRLYNWETATSACPDGWHLSTKDEWDILNDYAGGIDTFGKHLKAASGWNLGNGQDTYGFAAIPGGLVYSSGIFVYLGDKTYWWTSTNIDNYSAYSSYMGSEDYAYRLNDDKRSKYSVRCIQDLIPQQ